MASYSLSKIASGSNKDNSQTRNISSVFPYTGGTYKTISYLSRKNGIWCSAGGTSQSVTMAVYDQLINTSTSAVIKTSNTVSCKSYGTGPSSANYATTEFTGWTQAESNAAIAAWSAGTLQIKRIVSISSYTSSGHGTPTFRDGYYDDTISIQGTTTPFTNYGPKVLSFDAYRSSNGTTETDLSTTVYIKARASISNTAGLNASPRLYVRYSTKEDFSASVSEVTVASTSSAIQAFFATTMTPAKLSGSYSVGTSYYMQLVFKAGEEYAYSGVVSIGMAHTPIHVSGSNCGVAVGMYSNATASKKMFESNYPIYAYGGIAQVGDGSLKPLAALGMQSGQTAYSSIAADTTYGVTITFPKAFAAAPVVVLGLASKDGGSNLGSTSVSVADGQTTATSVRARVRHDGSGTVQVAVTWIAIGTY